jgi:hypothetical protein
MPWPRELGLAQTIAQEERLFGAIWRSGVEWRATVIAFTAVVIVIFITLGVGRQPAYWVYLLPLFPLALLMLRVFTWSCCRMPPSGAAGDAPADRE